MITSQRIFTKLRLILYDQVFKNTAFGYNKRSKEALDADFENGKWEFLDAPSEKGRYDNIIELYTRLKPGSSLLDIGCGQGILYKYLNGLGEKSPVKFCGIDISDKAIEMAETAFPSADFRTINFENETVREKFDVIVFNETIYYFGWPLKILQKCCQENLNPDGIVIISMQNYQGRNERIWKQIAQNYSSKGEVTAINAAKQRWDCKAIQPK